MFRPVAKSRGRQSEVASRHSSTVPDATRTRTPAPPQSRALSVINDTPHGNGPPTAPEVYDNDENVVDTRANAGFSPEQHRRPPVLVSCGYQI